jgi:hypothetical protein
VDNGRPTLLLPDCDVACARLQARIQRVYHDARTQDLLVMLAQTPAGQQTLAYLLPMGERLGERFISWRDLLISALGTKASIRTVVSRRG